MHQQECTLHQDVKIINYTPNFKKEEEEDVFY